MGHVFIEFCRLITIEPITNLIVCIHHTVRLIDLSKNNYVTRLVDNRIESYGSPKFKRTLSDKNHIYVIIFIKKKNNERKSTAKYLFFNLILIGNLISLKLRHQLSLC